MTSVLSSSIVAPEKDAWGRITLVHTDCQDVKVRWRTGCCLPSSSDDLETNCRDKECAVSGVQVKWRASFGPQDGQSGDGDGTTAGYTGNLGAFLEHGESAGGVPEDAEVVDFGGFSSGAR